MKTKATSTITLDQLADLREQTDRVSEHLAQRLRGHLNALAPILAPRRVFGKYVGSKEAVARADDAYAQLTERYKMACGKPFDLRSDLDDDALSAMEHGMEIYPCEYAHDIEGKQIAISQPFQWWLTFRSDYTPAEMRNLLGGKGERRVSAMRQFVVNALAAQIVLDRAAGARGLLEDLRYSIAQETPIGLGKLPMVVVRSPLTSMRPPDNLIQTATRFSGVAAFIELIDAAAVSEVVDPFRAGVQEMMGAAK
ncbi:MAG: hypothetical protein R2762_14950 [Bryobacteraceae bacterium]